MKKRLHLSCLALLFILSLATMPIVAAQQTAFTLDDIMSYPFPNELTTSGETDHIAWAINTRGARNIYVAKGPEFQARKLTQYDDDDGQEISSLSISKDGKWIVYLRGGDFGSNRSDALPVNPDFKPIADKVLIWAIPFEGGDPVEIGEGESPVIAPDGASVIYLKQGKLFQRSIDGSGDSKVIISDKGRVQSARFSPDGNRIAFVSQRDDHAFIGIYSGPESNLKWIDPGFYRDRTPVWSPDGKHIVFIRRNGDGGVPTSILEPRHNPWSIHVGNAEDATSKEIWKAPETFRGNMPSTQGGPNLHWANGRIVFLSYEDGWPHLYSMRPDGSNRICMTEGDYMAEYISKSADGNSFYFAGNTGPDKMDIDRRHLVQAMIDGSPAKVLTPGKGLQWTPHETGDGKYLAFISATAQEPPSVKVVRQSDQKSIDVSTSLIPDRFPADQLVVPKQVVFNAPDGTPIHGMFFDNSSTTDRKPAIIYIHGGPQRQMLLGWHYSSYYSNAYAMNQFLASKGAVVLAVNYRLGIGYGYEFHRPVDGGTRGCSEYQDIKAAGEWLASQPNIDPSRIGVYGGSYGGYLTAMALGRDSDLFAVGVDIHGVHDRANRNAERYLTLDQFEHYPDAKRALEVAWESSPIAYVDTWKSPVMIIHADDDRNVPFQQSTDLVQRLLKKGVPMETLVIVNDTHHFMKFDNQKRVNQNAAHFLLSHLLK
jgi:dipeptidyl aminopeptidase/acylaminoacyl peptidase